MIKSVKAISLLESDVVSALRSRAAPFTFLFWITLFAWCICKWLPALNNSLWVSLMSLRTSIPVIWVINSFKINRSKICPSFTVFRTYCKVALRSISLNLLNRAPANEQKEENHNSTCCPSLLILLLLLDIHTIKEFTSTSRLRVLLYLRDSTTTWIMFGYDCTCCKTTPTTVHGYLFINFPNFLPRCFEFSLDNLLRILCVACVARSASVPR